MHCATRADETWFIFIRYIIMRAILKLCILHRKEQASITTLHLQGFLMVSPQTGLILYFFSYMLYTIKSIPIQYENIK